MNSGSAVGRGGRSIRSAAQADRATRGLRIEAAHLQGPEAVIALRDQLRARFGIGASRDASRRSAARPIGRAADRARGARRGEPRGRQRSVRVQHRATRHQRRDQWPDRARGQRRVLRGKRRHHSGKIITIEGGYNATCTPHPARVSRMSTAVPRPATPGDISSRHDRAAQPEGVLGQQRFGAGIDVLGSSQVTLDNIDLFNNHGANGGGVYIAACGSRSRRPTDRGSRTTRPLPMAAARRYGADSLVTATIPTSSDNCSPDGGGLSVPGGTCT